MQKTIFGIFLTLITLNLPAQQKPIAFKNLLGVNAFEWDFLQDPKSANDVSKIYEPKMAVIESFGGVRHYLDWQKIEPKRGEFTFNPANNGSWNYDAIYERCKQEGIDVLACIKGCPDWLQATYPPDMRDGENIPMPYGADRQNPASYIEQAKAGFQFAARYGSNKNINPSLVTVDSKPRWTSDPVNVPKIGLGLIKYIECDNERDKWWKGDKARQTPAEYAANLSAFYDGDKGKLGKNVGVKTADPNIKVVMAGLAKPDVRYVEGIIDWCRVHRGYKADGSVDLCFDVVNFHMYMRKNANDNLTEGIAPELSDAAETCDSFVRLGNDYHMPVWITESGYDVNPGSPQRAIAIGSKSIAQTQADWLIRSAFLFARHGIGKVFFYELYDDNTQNPTQFASCGFALPNQQRRPSGDYFYQAKHLIGDYMYSGTVSHYPIIDVYRKGGKSIYALMVPDERGKTVICTLNLGNATKAVIYNFKIGSDDMSRSTVDLTNHNLKIEVSETPVFVEAL
jgi:hypothetical protein